MFKIKNYRFGFDIWGLVLFAVIMIPNLIWFAVPSGNDILRTESLTPVTDTVASVFQVITVAALCLIKNIGCEQQKNHKWLIGITASVLIYILGWCLYYAEIINPVVILILCVAPCLALILLALAKKNGVAFISAFIFMVCHLIFGFANFIC